MLTLTDELRIGHPVIDNDHQRLIDIINDFTERENGHNEPALLHGTLKSLIEYAREHFEREQRIQAEAMYPYTEMHKAEHKVLLLQVTEMAKTYFVAKTKPLDQAAMAELRNLLRHWLIDHVRKFDTNMREWVAPAKQA